jgi:hypothetical protein
LIPIVKPYNIPSIKGLSNISIDSYPEVSNINHKYEKSSNKYSPKEYKNEKSSKYPPKNNIVFKIHIRTMLPYSAKKKKTNITAACSVIKPLTNSDSKYKINKIYINPYY